jgi:hypothetical protein
VCSGAILKSEEILELGVANADIHYGRPRFVKRSRGLCPGIILKSLVKSLTCRYCNLRDRTVVLRCRDSHHATLERVLFPLQSLQFQFSDQGVAEVWTHGSGGAELLDRCPMQELSCSVP